jgi:hypothetical protein
MYVRYALVPYALIPTSVNSGPERRRLCNKTFLTGLDSSRLVQAQSRAARWVKSLAFHNIHMVATVEPTEVSGPTLNYPDSSTENPESSVMCCYPTANFIQGLIVLN